MGSKPNKSSHKPLNELHFPNKPSSTQNSPVDKLVEPSFYLYKCPHCNSPIKISYADLSNEKVYIKIVCNKCGEILHLKVK
jgi:transcription elongation factor Elf1